MNKHQEHHCGLHQQHHSEQNPQTDMGAPVIAETDNRESALDELEEMMFKRAR